MNNSTMDLRESRKGENRHDYLSSRCQTSSETAKEFTFLLFSTMTVKENYTSKFVSDQ